MSNSDSPLERKPEPRTVLCPSCGKEVRWTTGSPFRPFCKERCKLIDLGQWASEQYRISAESASEDASDNEAPDHS